MQHYLLQKKKCFRLIQGSWVYERAEYLLAMRSLFHSRKGRVTVLYYKWPTFTQKNITKSCADPEGG